MYKLLVMGRNSSIFVNFNNDAISSTQIKSQPWSCQTKITKNDSKLIEFKNKLNTDTKWTQREDNNYNIFYWNSVQISVSLRIMPNKFSFILCTFFSALRTIITNDNSTTFISNLIICFNLKWMKSIWSHKQFLGISYIKRLMEEEVNLIRKFLENVIDWLYQHIILPVNSFFFLPSNCNLQF